MISKEKVHMKCNNCGHNETVNKYCPMTGHMVGKGWSYVCPSCKDNLVIEETKPLERQYRILAYIPVEMGGDEPVFDTLQECLNEIDHLKFLQPENIYYAEAIEEDDYVQHTDVEDQKEEGTDSEDNPYRNV
jgi:hypothetical protein